MALYTAIDS